ncbi:MAG: alpha/beta hydrolase [Zoogloeaceae bacterium]|jgi:alpha/beta superfamily hydrolase|nr:alpha/beta hydrolase [Zoogloeaceae bacterium]
MTLRSAENRIHVAGPAGRIEVLQDAPADDGKWRGIALVAHPHPIGGGTNTNKVAHTLAKILSGLGYIALRPNFRGVGETEGAHDEGNGETEDLLAVLQDARRRFGNLPVALAGFSFGAYCQTRVARHLSEQGQPAERLILVGTAAGFVGEGRERRVYDTRPVPPDTIVIHGARDVTVPLASVLAWAEPQELPVIVVPGADHFFHRRLHVIRAIVTRAWR